MIISDQGTEFCNSVIEALSKELNIQRIKTSPYHPQSNGKTERFNRVMNDIISKQVSPTQRDWDTYLPSVLTAYRTSTNETSHHTPFFLVTGRDPVLPMDTLLMPKQKYMAEDYVPIMLERLHKSFTKVKHFMGEAREKNKQYVANKAVTKDFKPGDAVYYLDKRGHPEMSRKLISKWKPYYRVIEKTSPVNYRIKSQLTGNAKVVHVENIIAAHCENSWDQERVNMAPVMGKYHEKREAKTRPNWDTQEVPTRQQPIRAARLAIADALAPLPNHWGDTAQRKRKATEYTPIVLQPTVKPRTVLPPENSVQKAYNLRPRKRTYDTTHMPGQTQWQPSAKRYRRGTNQSTQQSTTRAKENEMEISNAEVIKKSNTLFKRILALFGRKRW